MTVRSLVVRLFVPKKLVVRRHAMAAWRAGEPELKMIPTLCEKSKISIDAGANYGVYTFFMSQYSREVIAVEPNPRYANLLRNGTKGNVKVIEGAVSDRSGEAVMRVPVADEELGMATIEPQNSLHHVDTTSLPVKLLTLDSLATTGVSFIKVDVEGHELAVLRGALGIISRDLPAILVEAEERHRPNAVASTHDLLRPYGYRGFFLLENRLASIDQFDVGKHQDVRRLASGGDAAGSSRYVSNFLFLARDIDAALKRLVA
jgi:FkbM family methyltransferase